MKYDHAITKRTLPVHAGFMDCGGALYISGFSGTCSTVWMHYGAASFDVSDDCYLNKIHYLGLLRSVFYLAALRQLAGWGSNYLF